tara:strand:+ start:517 stop:1206 length:690 start_codon:yes stop_codon:yes gene_type:complete
MSNHTEEARNLQKKVDSMQIIGADADFTGKNKYAIVMQGNLYYFPVHSTNVDTFLNDFKKGGKYFKIADGRLPNLLTNKTLTTNQQLKIIEKGIEPAISNYDYLQQELSIAKKNGDLDKQFDLEKALIDFYEGVNKTKYIPSEGLADINILEEGEETNVKKDESKSVAFGPAIKKGAEVKADDNLNITMKGENLPSSLPQIDYLLNYDEDGEVESITHNPATFYMKGAK